MNSHQTVVDDEIDLRQLFAVLWRGRYVILGTTLSAALIAVLLSSFVLPRKYESLTLIQLSEQSAPAYATPLQAIQIITSLSFLEPIAQAGGIPERGEGLQGFVRAEPVRDTRIVRIRIRYGDAARLRTFTQAVVHEFIRRGSERVERRRQLARRRLATVDAQLTEIERHLRATRRAVSRVTSEKTPGTAESGIAASFVLNAVGISEGLYSSLLSAQGDLATELVTLERPYLLQAPYIPGEPVSPRPFRNTMLAAVLGLLVAAVGVLVRDYSKATGRAVTTGEPAARGIAEPVRHV